MSVQKRQPVCIHCGGSLIKDDGERKCLSCSRVWKTRTELHRFYEEHKTEILRDIAELGRPATLKKWQIPSTTMFSLLKSWLGSHESPAPVPAAPSSNGKLPELPAFSNEWTGEVQLAWLNLYRDLAIKSK